MNEPIIELQQRIDAKEIFAAGVNAVLPAHVLSASRIEKIIHAASQARRIIVVGGGKAGAGMVLALESALGPYLGRVEGIVNVPDDIVQPTQRVKLHASRPTGLNEPTFAGMAGVAQMMTLVKGAEMPDLVIVLLSGGASALMPAPVDGISLDDKIAITRLMSAAGVTIQEMNCVRKHLSCVKGGRLAEAASHAGSIWSLIISDVVGDPIDAIASGPTAPDPTTFAEAWRILESHHLLETVSANIVARLQLGVAGRIAETPKNLPDRVHNQIIARNADALSAAAAKARTLNYDVVSLDDSVTGETQAAAKSIVPMIRQLRKANKRTCMLIGGETTVTLAPEHGLGGRNQEFVLTLACELEETELGNVTILSGGTDGEDGPTDAAGAFLDQSVLRTAQGLGLNARDYLQRHDSYHFFNAVNAHMKTGLTGTNVMDVRIVLVSPM